MTDIKALDAAATLLPCPFCGGEAEIFKPRISIGDDDADVDYLRAYCTKCSTTGVMHRFANHDPRSDDFQSARSKAITAWNTRAKLAPADGAAVEALGEALHGLSAILLLNRALEDDKAHAAYEKVVDRFAALAAMGEG